ncbi:MAG: sigma-54 interaction domain-containing protein, partial [Fidelibacterota bacterium]
KELIARAIHYNSPRHKAKLIVVNCASIPDNLLESELFGYEKGAFTGAMKQRIGKFEQANNGTIFLDEVGDLNIDLQAKILRVLQDKQIERIGGKRAIQLDLRFIAATNQDLEEKVKRKEFREDLYYRLNVITIKLPPLRERKEDIPLLVEHFLSKYKKGKSFKIDPQVINIFADYNWPGNIRELENVIERATVLADGDTITLEDLPPPLLEISSLKKDPKTPLYHMEDLSLEEIERRAIISALERSRGNKSKAAKMLKIPRHVLLYRLKKYKIDWPN